MLTRVTDRNHCGARLMSPFSRKIRLRRPQILLAHKRHRAGESASPQCYFVFDLAFLRPPSP